MLRPFLFLAICAIAVSCTTAQEDNDADFLEFTDFDFEEETAESKCDWSSKVGHESVQSSLRMDRKILVWGLTARRCQQLGGPLGGVSVLVLSGSWPH